MNKIVGELDFRDIDYKDLYMFFLYNGYDCAELFMNNNARGLAITYKTKYRANPSGFYYSDGIKGNGEASDYSNPTSVIAYARGFDTIINQLLFMVHTACNLDVDAMFIVTLNGKSYQLNNYVDGKLEVNVEVLAELEHDLKKLQEEFNQSKKK